jgi:hypothetical protein
MITFKPNTTLTLAMAAIEPLAQERGWTFEQMTNPSLPMDDHFDLTMVDEKVTESMHRLSTKAPDEVSQWALQQMVGSISFITHGMVLDNFEDKVRQVGVALDSIAVTSSFELVFHDALPRQANAHLIWYGDTAEIETGKKSLAIIDARNALMMVGFDGATLNHMMRLKKHFDTSGLMDAGGAEPSGLDHMAIFISALAVIFPDVAVSVCDLRRFVIGRGHRNPVYGEAVELAKKDEAFFAVEVPHTLGAWYCFDLAGRLVSHLVPFNGGLSLSYLRKSAKK